MQAMTIGVSLLCRPRPIFRKNRLNLFDKINTHSVSGEVCSQKQSSVFFIYMSAD